MIRESILSAHDRRAALVSSYESAITSLKTGTDSKGFKSNKKALDEKFSSNTKKISNLVKDLQTVDPEASAKVRYNTTIGYVYDCCCSYCSVSYVYCMFAICLYAANGCVRHTHTHTHMYTHTQ